MPPNMSDSPDVTGLPNLADSLTVAFDSPGPVTAGPPNAGWLSMRQLFAISAYWFATNLHWAALLTIIIPMQVAVIDPAHRARTVGLIQGVGAIVALIAPPVVGAFSDRCTSRWGRRRPYMAAGVGINVLGLMLLWYGARLVSLPLYFAGYMVVQLGNNIATGSYTGIIPDLVPKSQHGLASGYMASMSQSGTVVGALASGILMGKGHTTLSYLVIVMTLLIMLGVSLVGIREKPLREAPAPLDVMEMLRSFWIDPREHPDFGWVWLTRALVTLGQWCVQTYLLYFMTDVLHAKDPSRLMGYVLGVALSAATVTGILGGRLSDSIGRKRVVYFANTLIGVTALSFLFAHTVTVVLIIGAVYGIGFGAYYSVDWALGCDVLPHQDEAAKDMGVWHVAMVLPQCIAPLIAGPALEYFGRTSVPGHYSLQGYSVIFGLAAFFLLLGAVLLRNVKSVR